MDLETIKEASERTGYHYTTISRYLREANVKPVTTKIIIGKMGKDPKLYRKCDIDSIMEIFIKRTHFKRQPKPHDNTVPKNEHSFSSYEKESLYLDTCPRCNAAHGGVGLICTSNTKTYAVYTCLYCGNRYVLDKENIKLYNQGGSPNGSFEKLFSAVEVADFNVKCQE